MSEYAFKSRSAAKRFALRVRGKRSYKTATLEVSCPTPMKATIVKLADRPSSAALVAAGYTYAVAVHCKAPRKRRR